jgi:DNA (cytosine-5)-methyltransferase 1
LKIAKEIFIIPILEDLLKNIAVVDLFCGVGGLTHGFVKEGFNVVAGIDLDESCRYAFEKNNHTKFIQADLMNFDFEIIRNLYNGHELKILIGCPPCQPFSNYVKGSSKDNKWELVNKFGEIIEFIKPDIISMENVPGLLYYKKKSVLLDFVDLLKRNGYFVRYDIVYCPDYGIPQKRKRIVLLASKFGPIELVEKTHKPGNYKTVADTISHLPPIEDGDVCKTDPLHRTRKFSPMNKTRIMNTPEGGDWRDWKDDIVLNCHKKSTGKGYGSICGRLSWKDLAPTITTQCIGYGNGRFGHPEQDRALSLREAALLQSFPEDYDFIDPSEIVRTTRIARQIGNAVKA